MIRAIIRTSAFISNWVAWVVRQPLMLLTMIIGPFLILALFALSNAAQAVRAQAIVVSTPETAQEVPVEALGSYFDVLSYTEDLDWARGQLEARQVDAVLVLPDNPRQYLAGGEQAEIQLLTNQIDPITLSFLEADMRSQIAQLNTDIQRQGVENTKAEAADTEQRLGSSMAKTEQIEADAENPAAVRAGVDELDRELTPTLERIPALSAAARAGTLVLPQEEADPILTRITEAERTAGEAAATLAALKVEAASPVPNPARVRQLASRLRGQLATLREDVNAVQQIPTDTLVQPFTGSVVQVAPYEPSIVTFYAPAALAMLLQHFAVTLAALSMVRARLLGMVEFWQIAPIRSGEIVAGNYFSYGILSLAAWAALTAATVYLIGVPVLGDVWQLLGGAALLILASLGIGFVISLVATNEQQAAQLAMLVLLGSVFLSGFVRPLESVDFPIRYVSYLLPATFGIQIFQDVMLRGLDAQVWHLLALGAVAVAGLAGSLTLFRRELRPV